MANDVFTIKDNVTVEFLIPSPGTFIWGVNNWDDGGVWDSNPTSEAWTNLACETFDIDIEKGCELESGIFVQPSSSVAKIRMQGVTYDPFSNSAIHPGTQVRIMIEPNPDTSPGSQIAIWQGIVRNFSASYNQKGNNIITINAVDAMQDFLNTKVASYVVPALANYPGNVLTDLANTYYTGLSGNINPDVYYLAAKTYTNTTVGEIVQDCLTAGLGALWIDRDGTMNYRSEQDLTEIANTFSFNFSTTHETTSGTHICMTDLVMKADSRDLPNEVIATYTGGSSLTLRNGDAYDLYGAISLSVTVPIDNSAGTQLWLDRLNLTTKLRRVESLTFDAMQRSGQLWDWWLADRIFDPNIVGYSINGIDFSETYFVTKQKDRITPSSWDITIELWRGI